MSAVLESGVDPAQALWRHGADLLALIDAGGRVTAASPAWQSLLGRDDAAGSVFADLLQIDDRDRAAVALERARRGERLSFTLRCLHGDGRPLAVDWSTSAGDGTVFLIGRRSSGVATQQRVRRMLALGRLTGGIAHDFNNLLQALRNALELVRLKASDEEAVRRWVEAAMRTVDRGAQLTAQLVASATAPREDGEPVAVEPRLQALAAALPPLLPPLVRIVMAPLRDAASVLTDPAQLDAALLALALNAGEAMPAGGVLTIACERAQLAGDAELPTGEYVAISVADTGAGMSEAVRARAFEPFFTTKAVGDGSGLGLSQVQGYCHRYGGRVRIQSSGEGGTTLQMLLPALTLPAQTAADTVVVVAVAEAEARKRLCDRLRLLGYRALPVGDGAAAAAAAARHAAAAVVAEAGLGGAPVDGVARIWLGPAADAASGDEVLPKRYDLPMLAAAVERAVARAGGRAAQRRV